MCPLTWTIVVLRTGRRSRPRRADVAQLVAHHLAKVRVAGSNPVIRSKVQVAWTPTVEWPSGEATACKAVHTGSIPVSTSKLLVSPARLAQRESASLTRKRSLVQSQYRAPCLTQVRDGFYRPNRTAWARHGLSPANLRASIHLRGVSHDRHRDQSVVRRGRRRMGRIAALSNRPDPTVYQARSVARGATPTLRP